jgi:hypothetical protein
MNMEKYTQESQEALHSAQRIAQELNHQAIEQAHLLLALRIHSGEFQEGDVVRVDRGPEGLAFTPVVQAEVVEE